MEILPVTLAVLSAVTFAISASVQHQAAENAPKSVHALTRLVPHLLRQPAWVTGQLLAVVAFALHAGALYTGPIAVVQPIVVSSIVWAVVVRAALSRKLPARNVVGAVLVTGACLAVFLVASAPTPGMPAGLGGRTVVITAVGIGVTVLAYVAASRVRRDQRRKGFFLGVVGGVLFGLVAGLLKLSLQQFDEAGWLAVLAAWSTYVLVMAGVGGVLVSQRAYRTTGLSASMPAMYIVDGMTALTFGFIVFAEVPRHTPLFLALEIAAAVGMAVGLWLLTRAEEAHQHAPRKAPWPSAPNARTARGCPRRRA